MLRPLQTEGGEGKALVTIYGAILAHRHRFPEGLLGPGLVKLELQLEVLLIGALLGLFGGPPGPS
eukprot:4608925-Pyramimonas_sp.AAC.1